MMYVLTGIKYFSYLVGFIGVIGVFVSLGFDAKRLKQRFQLSQNIRYKSYSTEWMKYKLLQKYNYLLASAWPKYQYMNFAKFIISQFVVFVILWVLTWIATQSFLMGLVTASTFVYGFPIAYLYMRYKFTQNAIQNDIVDSIIILLQEYQKNHHNMLYALKSLTEQTTGDAQMVYAKLFARMHENDQIKKMAIETFAFQLNYFRGKNLALTILKAVKDGIDVEVLLKDMIADITEYKKRVRDAESESRETALLGFAPLPLLVLMIYLNDNVLLPGADALKYHFGTPLGLKVFIITLIFAIVNFGMALLIKKPKQL